MSRAQGLGTGLEPDALLATADRLVELCVSRGAAEAECFIEASRSLNVEIEAGRISVTGADHTLGVGIRLLVHGKLGFAAASGATDKDLQAAVEDAIVTAGHGRMEGYSLPVPASRPQPVPGLWDDAIAAMEAGQVVDDARRLLARWREVIPEASLPGGGVGVDAGATAIVSTAGVQTAERGTGASASVSFVERGDTTVNAWESVSRTALPLGLDAIVDEAARKLKALRQPRPAPHTGEVDVVLAPEAVHELLGSFVMGAVHGDEALRGNTKWSDRMGQTVADTRLDIYDDPHVPGTVGATAYDGEGVPTERLPILSKGVLQNFLFDSWNGHRHGRKTTGSAVRGGYDDRPSIGVHHLMMDHTRRLDDLVADVEKGYLVDTLLGAHTANPTTGDFSVTAPNVWAIEGGAATYPCQEIALAGSVPTVLENVRALSKAEKQMPHARLPRVLASGFQVST